MANLVTIARAQQNASLGAMSSSDPTFLDNLLAAASGIVRKVCSRDFTLTSYSELHSGRVYTTQDPLLLRQFPVTRIARVATNPVAALTVSNNGSTCQRATVETLADGTGVMLQYQINGAALATQTFLYSNYATLATLATAITTFGNGFAASVSGSAPYFDITKAASTELWPLQGASTCFGSGARLTMYVEDLVSFGSSPTAGWDGDIGEIQCAYGWRLDNETGEIYGRMPQGDLNIRVDYTAGFATIPDLVQEATVQLAKYLYDSGNVNHNLKEAKLGRASEVLNDFHQLPPFCQSALSSYRAWDRTIARI